MKDQLGRKIMTNFAGLGSKMSSYLKDDGSDDKKLKYTKRL